MPKKLGIFYLLFCVSLRIMNFFSQTSKHKKSSPKRAYMPWNEIDDAILLRMHKCKMAKTRMARFFERSVGAINSRIEKLTEEM
ncbi:MAG: Uncharacterised protein [Bacteroidota bacterium]|nr:MAG: Uncharacterised protein [Bacteroidota bacterium]